MNGQDSRLNLLGHWEGGEATLVVWLNRYLRAYQASSVSPGPGWERVEVVPEATLRGAVSLIEQARYCVTAALNCPAHPWHGSDEARKWLIEAARYGRQ